MHAHRGRYRAPRVHAIRTIDHDQNPAVRRSRAAAMQITSARKIIDVPSIRSGWFREAGRLGPNLYALVFARGARLVASSASASTSTYFGRHNLALYEIQECQYSQYYFGLNKLASFTITKRTLLHALLNLAPDLDRNSRHAA